MLPLSAPACCTPARVHTQARRGRLRTRSTPPTCVMGLSSCAATLLTLLLDRPRVRVAAGHCGRANCSARNARICGRAACTQPSLFPSRQAGRQRRRACAIHKLNEMKWGSVRATRACVRAFPLLAHAREQPPPGALLAAAAASINRPGTRTRAAAHQLPRRMAEDADLLSLVSCRALQLRPPRTWL